MSGQAKWELGVALIAVGCLVGLMTSATTFHAIPGSLLAQLLTTGWLIAGVVLAFIWRRIIVRR